MKTLASQARASARLFLFLGLATAGPTIARAQSEVQPVEVVSPEVIPAEVHPMYVPGPDVNIAPDPNAPVNRWRFGTRLFRYGHNSDWGLHAQQTPIPRTFSYYYTPWLNHPRHYKVVEPDGTIGWRTTVHGQPRGTPWPSPYLIPARPHHHPE